MSGLPEDRVEVGELVIRVFDLGPEPAWHEDRGLFGPWRRYVAEVADGTCCRGAGRTPAEAVRRLVVFGHPWLARRWPAKGTDER